ncbi:MAG: hypothetical protein Pars2KO_12750 [Parasphingorhabdus sp.]
MASFNGAIAGCTAGLTETGLIDQKALAAAGWKVTERTSRLGGKDRDLPLDSYPELADSEYEATTWTHKDHKYDLSLVRWDEKSNLRLADSCDLVAHVNSDKDIEAVLYALETKFDRKPDRSGTLPRGGDFLTPRFDKPSTGYYWAMQQHDVYLTVNETKNLRLEVVAMPDRGAVDEYSSDNPEQRIPS